MEIKIDGSRGEGGGQILRTALSLSVVTGRSFRVTHIRSHRKRPGLMRQHLTAVKAAAEICGAEVNGASLGSTVLDFKPGKVRPGRYSFTTGTAGSATLVLQTVLYPLLSADKSSTLEIIGGTHNMAAPPADFLIQTFLPQLKRMGVNIDLECEVPGFFPAGGGRLNARINPLYKWETLETIGKFSDHSLRGKVLISQLPNDIARREASTLAGELGLPVSEVDVIEVTDSPGPGNVVLVFVDSGIVTETFSSFGRLGYAAERVAEDAAREVKAYLSSRAPVGPYLADQLLIPLALAGRSSFCTSQLTPHAKTNMETIGLFLDRKISVILHPSGNCTLKTD